MALGQVWVQVPVQVPVQAPVQEETEEKEATEEVEVTHQELALVMAATHRALASAME